MSKDAMSEAGESSKASEPTTDGFEATLKEVVNAKRLSASKMGSLTDMSLKLMEYDTQLVSILYRTHKSLPAKAKISSLYVFDSMCRAARSHVNKQKLTGDIHSGKGNAASFLLKIEGVLDGLFQDMVASTLPEAKEKTKKVLDIWTKANTFPPNVLTRLAEQGKEAEKETKQTPSKSTTTTDPRKHPTPPIVSTPAPPAPSSVSPVTTTPSNESAQAALLALLSTATAATANSQTAVNTSNVSGIPSLSAPSQDPAKLLLQQLTNNIQNGLSNPVPPQQVLLAGHHTFPQGSSFSRPNPHSPTTATSFPGSNRRDPGFNGYDGPSSRGYGRPDFHDNRRGGFRGEHGRGGYAYSHGTEEFGLIGRYEERNRYRHGDDRGSYSGRRYNRSRSPPPRKNSNTREDRREIRPYSPPGRPSLASLGDEGRSRDSGKRASPSKEPGKDEFGRDIRSPSVGAYPAPEDRALSETRQSVDEEPVQGADKPSQHQSPSANLPPGKEDKASLASTSKPGGLETFDFSLFNPTDSASWKALGNAFEVTNGYVPSQEELIQLIMTQMMGMGIGTGTGMGFAGMPNQPSLDFSQEYGYAEHSSWNEGPSNMESSNVGQAAGGKSNPDMPETTENEPKTVESGGAGGQMRKVGDRWIFVRDRAQS